MSRVPMASPYTVAAAAGLGGPFSGELKNRYPGEDFNQFRSAEKIARDYGISREAMDEFSLASHRKASAAIARGEFEGRSFLWWLAKARLERTGSTKGFAVMPRSRDLPA